MATDTELQQMIINIGTQAKVDAARQAGTIGPDDFVIVTDAPELQEKLTSANAGTGISITEVGGVTKINNTQTSAEWGNITGTLSNQTDLNQALSGKQNSLTEGAGIDITNDVISNDGVRSVSTGSTNGTISVNTGGTSAEVSVAGLGSAAYTASTAYATSAQGDKADSAVQDVKIDDTSIVSNNIATIPYGTNAVAGAAKAGSGLASMAGGVFYIYPATDAAIQAKTNNANPIVPKNLDKAIMEGLGNYGGTAWTDGYKYTARDTIGATQVILKDWD